MADLTEQPAHPTPDLGAIVRAQEAEDRRAKSLAAAVIVAVLGADPATLPPPVAAARAKLIQAAGPDAPGRAPARG